MNRVNVESSLISSIGYDPEKKLLEVEFKSNGKVYEYENVPLNAYEDFKNSFSIGKHFLNHIKNNYSYKQV